MLQRNVFSNNVIYYDKSSAVVPMSRITGPSPTIEIDHLEFDENNKAKVVLFF